MQILIKIGSSQYLVEPGQEIIIPHQEDQKGEFALDKILLIIDGHTVKIGTPFLEGTSVQASILGEEKGQKLRIATYKAKSRYRKVRGFRAQYTKIKIGKIKEQPSVKIKG